MFARKSSFSQTNSDINATSGRSTQTNFTFVPNTLKEEDDPILVTPSDSQINSTVEQEIINSQPKTRYISKSIELLLRRDYPGRLSIETNDGLDIPNDDSYNNNLISPLSKQQIEYPPKNPKISGHQNSFYLDDPVLVSNILNKSPVLHDTYLNEPGDLSIYDSFVIDDLKLVWTNPIRESILLWWPLLFGESTNAQSNAALQQIIQDQTIEYTDEKDIDENDIDISFIKPTLETQQSIDSTKKFSDMANINVSSSSLRQLLGKTTTTNIRIVNDNDVGEGNPIKNEPTNASQPKKLEKYKKRLWLVHLQRPQIKFKALNSQVLLGSKYALVQGFGFHINLLPKADDFVNTNQLYEYLPPKNLIDKIKNEKYSDKSVKMPYFKIRICASLKSAKIFVIPSNIEQRDNWISSEQLELKEEKKEEDEENSKMKKKIYNIKTSS